MELTHAFRNIVVKYKGSTQIFNEAMEVSMHLDEAEIQISECDYILIMVDGEHKHITDAVFMKILTDELEIYGHTA